MKKGKLLFSMLAMAMLFVGCAKDDAEKMSQKPESRTLSVQPLEFSTKTLKFESMDALHDAIIDISAMDATERDQWFAAQDGFESMAAAGYRVVQQMTALGDKDAILALRPAYADLFIFDPNQDEVRVAPLFKASKPGYQWICNAYGDVEVAGRIVNMNDIKTFDQTWLGKRTREVSPLELTNGTRRLYLASSCNVYGGKAQVFIRYTSEAREGRVWYPAPDTYTVSAVDDPKDEIYPVGGWLIKGEEDLNFQYYKVPYSLNSFSSRTMSPHYQHDDFIGFAPESYYCAYKIYSSAAGKEGEISLYN